MFCSFLNEELFYFSSLSVKKLHSILLMKPFSLAVARIVSTFAPSCNISFYIYSCTAVSHLCVVQALSAVELTHPSPSLWWSLKRHFLMCLLPLLSPKITAKFVTDFLSVSLPYTLQYSSLKIRRHVVFFSSFSVLGSPFPLENKPNRNEGF